MKKFISRLFVFFLFSFVLYTIFIFLWGSIFDSRTKKNMNYKIGSYGYLFSRLNEVNKFKDVDILFVGSSHAYRSFDPRIFNKYGIKTFNLGSSSQTPLQTKILLERYLNKLNPKLIIYEVYPVTFEIDGVESAIDLISNSQIDFDIFIMTLKVNHIKVYNTFIFSLINDLLCLKSKFHEKLKRGKDTYITGGYVERNDTIKFTNEIKKKKWEMNKKAIKEFEDILKMIHAAKKQILLVQTPITQNLYKSYENNREIDNYFASKGAYLNFNEIINMNNYYFYDNNHLNKTGVRIFNEKFISKLKQLNLL